jgi:hypothetical protein
MLSFMRMGIGGGIFGAAARKGLTIPRQCPRIAGTEDEQVRRAQGGHKGPFGECEAESNQSTAEPYAPCGAPCSNGLGGAQAARTPVWRCQQPEDT